MNDASAALREILRIAQEEPRNWAAHSALTTNVGARHAVPVAEGHARSHLQNGHGMPCPYIIPSKLGHVGRQR